MMGYLFVLLLLVSRYFSVSTSVIGKGLLGNREESPSFERNKMPFQSERIPSFFFGIYEHFKTQTTRHGQERSMESLQAKRDQETGRFYFPSGAVFKTPLEALLKAKFFVSVPKLPRKKMTVTIYEVDSGVKVSSRHLSFPTSGWVSLNAVNLVNQWISRSHFTFPGLKVLVNGSKGGEESTSQVRQLWLVVYSAKPDHYGEDFLQSSLVVEEAGIPFAKGRIRREAATTQSIKNQTESPSPCSRKDMMITSSDFGKRDGLTLLHPRVFNAYQCSGECSFKEKNNNSKLRALIMRDNGHSIRESKSCCVPSKLRSIVMMQRTAERNYLISTLKNMIVESCTCY